MPVTRQEAEAVQQLVGELFIEIYTASPLQAIPIQASGIRAGISGDQVHVLVAFRIGGSEQAVEVAVVGTKERFRPRQGRPGNRRCWTAPRPPHGPR